MENRHDLSSSATCKDTKCLPNTPLKGKNKKKSSDCNYHKELKKDSKANDLPFAYSFERNHVTGRYGTLLSGEDSYIPFRFQQNCRALGKGEIRVDGVKKETKHASEEHSVDAVWLQDDEAKSFYQKGYFVLHDAIPDYLLTNAKIYVQENYDSWMNQVIRQDDWRFHFNLNFDEDLIPTFGTVESEIKKDKNKVSEKEKIHTESKEANVSEGDDKVQNVGRIQLDHADLLNLLFGSEKVVGRLYSLLGKMPKGIFYSQIALRTPVISLEEQVEYLRRLELEPEKESDKGIEESMKMLSETKSNDENSNEKKNEENFHCIKSSNLHDAIYSKRKLNVKRNKRNDNSGNKYGDDLSQLEHSQELLHQNNEKEKEIPLYTTQTNLGPYVCYQSSIDQIDNRPGTNYHIDGQSNAQGTRFPDYWTIEIGIALSDQTIPNCGNFTVWDGFHNDSSVKWHNYPEQKKTNTLPDLGEPTQICLREGDVVFAHVLLPHRGGMNVGLQVSANDNSTSVSTKNKPKQYPKTSEVEENLFQDEDSSTKPNLKYTKKSSSQASHKSRKRTIPPGTRQMIYMRIQGEHRDYYNSEKRAQDLLNNPWLELGSFLKHYILKENEP